MGGGCVVVKRGGRGKGEQDEHEEREGVYILDGGWWQGGGMRQVS